MITPASKCKGMLKPADLVVIDTTGKPRRSGQLPSSEFRIHLVAYRERPEIKAVVHAHPTHATAYALAGASIDARGMPEFEDVFGKIPFVPFGEPGSSDLAEKFAPFVHNGHTYLLENHGVVSVGASISEAFFRLEMAEHCAQILYLATQIEFNFADMEAMDAEEAELPQPSLNNIRRGGNRREREN